MFAPLQDSLQYKVIELGFIFYKKKVDSPFFWLLHYIAELEYWQVHGNQEAANDNAKHGHDHWL